MPFVLANQANSLSSLKSLRGGDDVTESAGEPPPEDPVGVRCAGGVTAGLTSEEVGGKAGPLVHLNG